MISEGIEQPWPDEVRSATAPFLQGHLISEPPLFYAADTRHPVWRATRLAAEGIADGDRGEELVDLVVEDRPPYAIVTTQSCDLAEEGPEPQQPWLSVAPVYEAANNARLRDRDYIFSLAPPALAGEWVADVRIEMPLEKSLLVGRTPVEAFPAEDGYIDFANFLARRRGRPALASVFHEVLTTTTKTVKRASKTNLKLARRARENVFKLMLAIEDGTRLKPVAAKLYVVTDGRPTDDAREWFGIWWDEARVVAQKNGLQLQPTGWLNAHGVDLRLLADLIEMRSPL